ncbi:MAG: hypothetical protein ACK45R_11565, partial [Candidatus Kapaibacterium sp.]
AAPAGAPCTVFGVSITLQNSEVSAKHCPQSSALPFHKIHGEKPWMIATTIGASQPRRKSCSLLRK